MLTGLLQFLRHHVGRYHFAEVKFYFTKSIGDEMRAFALVAPYHVPVEELLQISHNTLVVCKYQDEVLSVIDVEDIEQVVAMVPFQFAINDTGDYYYLIEQIGLDVMETVDAQYDDVDGQ